MNISQLSAAIPSEKRGVTYLSIDENSNDVIFVSKDGLDSQKSSIAFKSILQRIIDQETNPRIKKLVKYKEEKLIESNKYFSLIDLDNVMRSVTTYKDTSYRQKIANTARHDPWYSRLMFFGINPADDKWSLKCCEILKDFEEKEDVDFLDAHGYGSGIASPRKAFRYIASVCLIEDEKKILNTISLEIKSDPIDFLKELKRLKKSDSYNQFVLDKLIAQAEVWEVMQSIPKLKNFPFEDIWRFCIDIEFQKYGAYFFENEMGFITATLKALCYSLKLNKISYLDFIEINRKCGEKVLNENDFHPLSTRLRGKDLISLFQSYDIYGFSTMDSEGIQDLKERSEMKDTPFNLVRDRVHVTMRCERSHLREIKFLFYQYDKKISQAKNPGERLIAHIWLARELSLQHHMIDGNGRTAQLVFLSRLANDPKLPMMLLDTNPNLDTNGPVAYVQRVLQGMTHFNKMCGVKHIPLSFEEIDEMTNISEKRHWKYYHPSEEEKERFINEHPLDHFTEDLEAIFRAAAKTEILILPDFKKGSKNQMLIKLSECIKYLRSELKIFIFIMLFIIGWKLLG